MRISDWSSDVCSSDLYRSTWTCRTSSFRPCAPSSAPHWWIGQGSRLGETTIPPLSTARTPRWGTLRVTSGSSPDALRSEEHTSELKSLMRISYAVFCLKKNKHNKSNKICTHRMQKIQRN